LINMKILGPSTNTNEQWRKKERVDVNSKGVQLKFVVNLLVRCEHLYLEFSCTCVVLD